MEQKDIPMPPLPEEEPVQEEQVEEVQEEPTQEVQEPVKEQETSNKELNFAALREEKERLEKDHQDALRRLQEYEKPAPKEEDIEIELGDDDLFEGKHYKKLKKQLKKQQDELKQYQQQVNATTTETRLRSQYKDFDKVLTPENIELLRKSEPELAETIASTQDIYTKAVSAYKIIKRLGIYTEDVYDQEREIARKNSLKPKPLTSVSPQQGNTPLSRANAFANGLTPDLKAQLWKEMNESSQN